MINGPSRHCWREPQELGQSSFFGYGTRRKKYLNYYMLQVKYLKVEVE